MGDCTVHGARTVSLLISPEDAPPINCSPWYAFRLTPRAAGPVSLGLHYTACRHRYWPKISRDGETWERLPEDAVRVEPVGEDSSRAVLTLDLGDAPVWIAGQELLMPDDYAAWMSTVAAKSFVTRSNVGASAEGRAIDALTISEGTPKTEKVVLIGRQHPPEVTGGLALMPFVEALVSEDPVAVRFRERFDVTVVPILNPDGVVRGHWRHSTGGVDLNRDWGPFTQPETQLMRDLLHELVGGPDATLRLFLDFHSTWDDVFYTIPDENPTQPPLFTRDWLARLQERVPDYEVNRDARHTVGRPISKAYVYDTYGAPAVTYEIGDDTPPPRIAELGREGALAMMETLLASDPPGE